MCLATQCRFSGIERAERKCGVTKDARRLLALFVASGHNGEREDTVLSSQSLPQGLGGGDMKKQNWGEVREVSGEVPPHLRDLNDQEPDMESSRRKLGCRGPEGEARPEGGRCRRATEAEAPPDGDTTGDEAGSRDRPEPHPCRAPMAMLHQLGLCGPGRCGLRGACRAEHICCSRSDKGNQRPGRDRVAIGDTPVLVTPAPTAHTREVLASRSGLSARPRVHPAENQCPESGGQKEGHPGASDRGSQVAAGRWEKQSVVF